MNDPRTVSDRRHARGKRHLETSSCRLVRGRAARPCCAGPRRRCDRPRRSARAGRGPLRGREERSADAGLAGPTRRGADPRPRRAVGQGRGARPPRRRRGDRLRRRHQFAGRRSQVLRADVERRDANRATVVATIDPGDWVRHRRARTSSLSLLRQAGRWRIDDVSGIAEPNAWSLRDLLARATTAP